MAASDCDSLLSTCGEDYYIRENNYVIVKKGDLMKACQVKKNRPVYIGKQKINLSGIIGHEFGSLFQVKGDDLIKIKNEATKLNIEIPELNTLKDNRSLVDDGKSQKLTKDEIELLKDKGLTGEEMVEHLITNSSTFNEKTEFSQEKYLKKKQKKYTNQLLILKPITRLIVEMYSSQGSLKILNLRCDTVAQILTYSNVCSGGNYIIFDSCYGLVVGSALERIGKAGCIIQVYDMDVPQQQAVHMYNFPEDVKNCLVSVKFQELENILKEKSVAEEKLQESEIKCDSISEQHVTNSERRKLDRNRQEARIKKIMTSNDVDGFVIACKYSPIEPTLYFLKYLQLSRPFVIYCMYKEYLVELYTKLKESGNAVSLWITETWLREYQVLPNRTHPSINMCNSGGFLLTGIKVDPS